ncbi:MAG TPA: proline dehydrogenase family protein [Bryobacteraceae bacterium]|nr:proline dehydrogenase family protein [Bryobacteraceae bacterium]
MSSFIPAFRGAFLYLSRQAGLRRFMETSAVAQRLTSRFVAGIRLDDAIRVASRLREQQVQSSLDYLGENVSSLEEAGRSRDAFLAALDQIAADQLPATVSMKVTSLGLDLSEESCLELTDRVCARAQAIGSRVEFDMEDSSYTDRNLRIVKEMHSRYGAVRAVIQAYLFRSEQDVRDLCALRVPVRLCKGAYREPSQMAWQDKADVDANFIKLMRILFEQGTQPAIATHDEEMINRAITSAKSTDTSHEDFEFQMLYGVRPKLQRRVAQQGFRLRLYVPYGEAWYPYFMRRIAERPANALFVAKSLISG